MKPPKYSPIKNHIVTVVFVLLAMLIMATPVLANSSSWSFLMYYNTRKVLGNQNGVYHTMTAGTMTMQGSIWTTARYGTNPPQNPLQFDVYLVGGGLLGSDLLVCSSAPVTPPDPLNVKQAFSKGCGKQKAGKYYFIIWRVPAGDREVQGSGTLTTQ